MYILKIMSGTYSSEMIPEDREEARALARMNRGFQKGGPLRMGAAEAIRQWFKTRGKK